MTTSCAKCGAAMQCEPQPGGACWCTAQPHIVPQRDAQGCLCASCLDSERRRQEAVVTTSG